MDSVFNKITKLMGHFLLAVLLLQSCNGPETGKRASAFNNSLNIGGTSTTGGGQGAGPGDGGIGDGDGNDEPAPKVEIRHFVNPRTGEFQRKLTIPKNFSGLLYLSGLNITSLSNKHITVKFYFGHVREAVEVPAVVARAPGITPTTDIEVLVLDLDNKPFENLRLIYDLYDYNEYDFDEFDLEEGEFTNLDPSDEPVTSNLDDGLYCRGLVLDDDPSFTGSGQCDAEGEICLFSYAKVKDQAFFNSDLSLPTFPTIAQIDQDGFGYFSEQNSALASRCLPDNVKYVDGAFDISSAGYVQVTEDLAFDGLGDAQTIFETEYMFLGPYRATNKSLWQLSDGAALGPKGIFMDSLDENAPIDFGHVSLLFPRYIKRELQANVEHLSSTRPNGFKEIIPFPAAGTTEWMDGCSERVTTLNTQTNEHIGSCNVSAIVEIVARDPQTGQTEVVAGRADGGIDVKLQLTKSSAINNQGQDVLFTSLRSCQNSNGCGDEECCYNNRCWSKQMVSSCKEDNPGTGNSPVGASCSTDFDCSSLCCNQATGTCSIHDNQQDPPVLCSKPAGQACIAKEWCAQSVIQEYVIVKTGTDPQTGAVTCAVRPYNRLRHGDCLNGICVPPTQPQPPILNPADPNKCDEAVDPPSE